MEIRSCPGCRATTVAVTGLVTAGFEEPVIGHFFAAYVRSGRHKAGVVVREAFRACLSCGHVWSSLRPEELRDVLQTSGTKLARQHLLTVEGGFSHDLPDTPGRGAGRSGLGREPG